MTTIRSFKPNDTDAVADLFWQTFKHKQPPAPRSLKDYMRTLYFTNPSYDEHMSSLVYEDQQGRIQGFIGGIPVHFRCKDRKITALVAGNHMVNPNLNDPYAGTLLLRKFFAGPQDLTYTDTANNISVRMWKLFGAKTLASSSIRWIHILRPIPFSAFVMKRHALGKVCSSLLYPLSRLTDCFYSKIKFRPPKNILTHIDQCKIDTSTILKSLKDFMRDRIVFPDDNEESLNWRLSLASQKIEFGDLQKCGVLERGKLLGWYLYYVRKGGIAHVLQFVARAKKANQVLNHLFIEAYHQKALAVMGHADLKHITEYSKHNCHLFLRNALAMVHTRDPEILSAFLEDEAFISRLEGDWWTRLQGDEFT